MCMYASKSADLLNLRNVFPSKISPESCSPEANKDASHTLTIRQFAKLNSASDLSKIRG